MRHMLFNVSLFVIAVPQANKIFCLGCEKSYLGTDNVTGFAETFLLAFILLIPINTFILNQSLYKSRSSVACNHYHLTHL